MGYMLIFIILLFVLLCKSQTLFFIVTYLLFKMIKEIINVIKVVIIFLIIKPLSVFISNKVRKL